MTKKRQVIAFILLLKCVYKTSLIKYEQTIYFLTIIQNYATIILFAITLATLNHDCKLYLDPLLFTLGLKACKAVIHRENGCSESWE